MKITQRMKSRNLILKTTTLSKVQRSHWILFYTKRSYSALENVHSLLLQPGTCPCSRRTESPPLRADIVIFKLKFLLLNPYFKIKNKTQPFSCFSTQTCFGGAKSLGKHALLDHNNFPPHLLGLYMTLLSPSSSPTAYSLSSILFIYTCMYKLTHISTYLSAYHKYSLSFLILII